MKKNLIKNQKGFTLFMALIVSSMILAVGFSIGNIVLKQLLLSSSGKESQIAFYAADSGAECAIYWDRKNAAEKEVIDSVFSTTSAATANLAITCGTGYDGSGAVSGIQKVSGSDNLTSTTTFYINYDNPIDVKAKACAKVTVAKNGPFTIIESRGYNAGYTVLNAAGVCDLTRARTVERGLRLNF